MKLLKVWLSIVVLCNVVMYHRSPSPEPVYNHEGKRTNTREVRTRKKLEGDRHRLVQKMLLMNPQFRPPYDYRSVIIFIFL